MRNAKINKVTLTQSADSVAFTAFTEVIPQIVVITFASGRVQHVNRKGLSYTGATLEDLLGDGFFWGVHPDDRPHWIAQWAHAVLHPRSFELEYRLRRADGQYRWFLGCFEPLYDVDGKLSSWLCTSTDVDEHKRAREALQRLFTTIPHGVLYQDRSRRITGANPAAERMLGVSLPALLKRTFSDARWRTLREDGTALPSAEHATSVALRSGAPVLGQVIGIHHALLGETRWLSVDAIPQFQPGESQPYQVYAHLEDITERKTASVERERLLEQLALERSRLDAVLAQMPPGVIVADVEGPRVSYVNAQMERIIGLTLTPGMTLERIEHKSFKGGPQGKASVGVSLNRALGGVPVAGEELEIKRPDGTTSVVMASAAPIHDRLGRIVAAVLTCEDLTERRHAESEIKRLTTSIQSAREALTLYGGLPVTPERFVKLMGELYAQLGQAQLEGRLVAVLLLHPDPVTLAQAAETLGVSKVAVSNVSGAMSARGDLKVSKRFSTRENLLSLTDRSYVRDLSVRRVASWSIGILCDALLESNQLDPTTSEQIKAHLETHTRVAVALERVLSPIERKQAQAMQEHLINNWDAVQPNAPRE
jgi:PAS domain S-box-containing protein